MGLENYITLTFVALSTTSLLILAPNLLPSIIIGSFVLSIIVIKAWEWIKNKPIGYYFVSIFAGVCALIAFTFFKDVSQAVNTFQLVFWIILGFGWLIIAIILIKEKIDSISGVKDYIL